MRQKLKTSAMNARLAAERCPYGPVDQPLEHRVLLPAPTTDEEAFILSDVVPTWCRRRMKENGDGDGEKWSRHRSHATGAVMFTFSSLTTATMFKLTFG